MRKVIIIIMLTFISSLFGCFHRNKTDKIEVFPKEKFVILDAILDNKPIVGTFNVAYKDFSKKAEYPWCLKIMIALNLENLFENDLPKDIESSIAYKLEDELLAEIQKIAVAHYIGHIFNDTFLDIYVYLDEPEKVHQYLQTQIDKEGLVRGFGYEINKDPKWLTVQAFLK